MSGRPVGRSPLLSYLTIVSNGRRTSAFIIVRTKGYTVTCHAPVVSSTGQKEKRTSHSSRVFKACLGVLLFAAMLEGQALNQFVFVVLVDPDVPKCDAYVCMVEDLFQCHGVVCLLVHMIAERLS